MATGRLLVSSKTVISGPAQRRRRKQAAENAGSTREASAAVPPGSPAPKDEGQINAEQARLLRKANAHRWVATQISELMQGNVARNEELRRLAGFLPPADQHADGSGGGRLPASASLRNEIEVLDRIIAWQTKTISWHMDEGRRLREQAARIRECPALGDAADPDRR
jgi:hypothetical protein